MLSLYAEKERRGEVLVCEDARREVAIFYFFKVLSLIVTMGKGNDPPNNFSLILCFCTIFFLPEYGENEPRQHEACDEG